MSDYYQLLVITNIQNLGTWNTTLTWFIVIVEYDVAAKWQADGSDLDLLVIILWQVGMLEGEAIV